jgi:hypothetical protein
MVEAIRSPQQAQAAGQAQPSTVIAPAVRASMGRAVRVLALQAAIKATKRQLRARGLKPQCMAQREIVAAAEQYLAEHWAELSGKRRRLSSIGTRREGLESEEAFELDERPRCA